MQSKLLTLELLSYHSPSYRSSVVEEMGKKKYGSDRWDDFSQAS